MWKKREYQKKSNNFKFLGNEIDLDKNMEGPDHLASLSPDELATFVEDIRTAEESMGSGWKQPAEVEVENAKVVRKRIVARKPIANGEAFSEENLTTKRASSGLSSSLWDLVIGRVSSRDYSTDDPIEIS